MGLFNKLKEILFDEVTTEIPVITKDEVKEEPKTVKKKSFDDDVPKRRTIEQSKEEVIIQKIETPKRKIDTALEEDHFDMPKLKEEAKEEVKKSSFTFPVYGDDERELLTPKRRERKEKEEVQQRREEIKKTPEVPSRRKETGGYSNAYDYSYGKYKGDYKSSREQNNEVLTKTLETKEIHKNFKPSPIISPVYGVLNENYKKEDIVSKTEIRRANVSEPLDLDSVRRKAYGTLEDEIEIMLNKKDIIEEVAENDKDDYDILEDDGISISDLLVDSTEEKEEEELEPTATVEDVELFDTSDLSTEDNIDDDIPDLAIEALEAKNEVRIPKPIEKPIPPVQKLSSEEVKFDEKENIEKKETLGEEDLFDLIDSLYDDKDDEK